MTREQPTKYLEDALRRTITDQVPKTCPHHHNKRWWTKDLTNLRNELKMLSKASHSFRAVPDHPSHRLCKEKVATYDKAIKKTKKEHWVNWLEEATSNDLWIANKYMLNPAGDRGKSHILTHKTKDSEGNKISASSNEDKSEIFANALFPPPPPCSAVPQGFNYPEPATTWTDIMDEQLHRTITKLSPYKAPGPDGIANASAT